MEILIVTGKLAQDTVKASVKDKADILVLDINVASFITPSLLKRSYPNKKYDLILISGLSYSDFSKLEKELGTKIRLGSKHAFELGFILDNANNIEFSTKIPACELLNEKRQKNAYEQIKQIEEKANSSFTISGLKIGGNSCMKVMAEIVNAAHLESLELKKKLNYFQNNGADIIDLGMSLETQEKEVKKTIEIAKSVTHLPLSIDTLNPDLINVGLESGIDLVLSLNSENMSHVKDNIIKYSIPSVVIPDSKNIYRNLELAQNYGLKKLIADPILDPIGHGIVESINRYYEFRKQNPNIPLFFGVGNVTELIDADSIGINAMLSGIAMELNASILFTPEFSDKAKGSVSELKTSSMMMALSKERNSSPKELGIDLLFIKEKRRRKFGSLPKDSITAQESNTWIPDPKGGFKIEITENGEIIAIHKKISISGNSAKEIIDTIIRLELVSLPEHFAYLGKELARAELALKFNRSYSQDDKF